MSNGDDPNDPRWHELMSLASHEFRTPLGVVQGYLRMLLKDQNLGDMQRHMLQEIEKSNTKMSAFCRQMSDLAALERGEAEFNRASAVAVGALVAEVVASLPAVTDGREITVRLENAAPDATMTGDPVRLRSALTALMLALRRELITSTELIVRVRSDRNDGQPTVRIAMADEEHIPRIEKAAVADLVRFDEWRGGVGLGLPVARRVLNAHGGSVWALPDVPRASALIELPAG